MVKSMKFLLLSFLMLMLLTLVACGGNDDASKEDTDGAVDNGVSEENDFDFEIVPEEGAELLFWSEGEENLDWAREMAEAFEAEYGVPVQVEEVNQEDAPERLATDGPSGLAGDVFASTHDRIGRAISAGLVLENFWPEEYEAEFMDAAIQATSFDNVLYGYPARIETYALYYNKDLVETAPITMDELIEVAKELNNEIDRGFLMEPGNFYFTYGFFGGYGGYVFGDNNTDVNEIGLNNEGSVKAVELIKKLRDEVAPGVAAEDITYDVRTSLFETGDMAFDINGPWAIQGYRSAGINFGIAPLPVLDNGQNPKSFSGAGAFYVNAYTPYPDAAALFAQFITSEESLLKLYETVGHLPPRLALLDNELIQSNPFAVAFLEQAEHAVPMPNVAEMPLVWGPMEAAVNEVWNNDVDIQEALDRAVNTIENAILEQQQ
ncbi:maltose ABC transporter substrate-binding protein [Anaerobacillus alkalilacustris]|uniref:Maltodextrin-binding protein n=1 Tax=Anaerobacillus alkalilacustris TaxID=393763 RepID=A0A1S2LE35_9BACI|nr:maltose ABC transporter substrate-binding protein [Anaerobacillus alkalilacustris]OIJ10500.1 maltose ABC transporter substrate-binding protein [Anaerobacillus alkalilacustris]